MEIAPVPHRSTHRERRRLVLGLVVLVPVVLLVLLPTVLGLDRYVVSDRSMHGTLGRGSVVLAREVPPSDLRAGDVITVQRGVGPNDDRVVRRIVAIHGDTATIGSDAGADARPLSLTSPSYSRVWLAIPWIGYPFVLDGGWLLLLSVAATFLALGVIVGRREPQVVARPSLPRQPVGSR
ncbi:MAG TPA: S26 family signal peptidase [Nocardioides sp.]|uniref:S26 family signal peptidase n=1 Tax=Nocardioides sp. TaxID=35761 RepID=UPI002E3203E4|nr:S26 family signal peptidase [Nocardioides sp.]HEX5088892.1 S26 family signal peptidase [Nocardioides sp.]